MADQISSSSAKQEQLEGITQPHANDVLSGRGNFVNHHSGNENFRALGRCGGSRKKSSEGSIGLVYVLVLSLTNLSWLAYAAGLYRFAPVSSAKYLTFSVPSSTNFFRRVKHHKKAYVACRKYHDAYTAASTLPISPLLHT
eukprot:scaffold4233_cov142-Skeletonema_dohrnii-CCMP3373.AAC.11